MGTWTTLIPIRWGLKYLLSANKVWGKVIFYNCVSFCSHGCWLPSMHHRPHDQEEGRGVFIWGVCIQGAGVGQTSSPWVCYRGVCIKGRGLHSGGSTSKGVSIWGGVCIQRVLSRPLPLGLPTGGLGRPLPGIHGIVWNRVNKWAVSILL